ncbi:MAG: hypothetical protein JO336_06680 [Acidobacteriia bacterium]|nr:hypothetical protein [Terriglobia bacterium]
MRAVLDAEKLCGEILTPAMRGAVSVFYIFTTGTELLGQTTVSADGRFEIGAPMLEQKSLFGGRLVIRVVDGQGRAAEGFVSVASLAEIASKTGAAMRNILAALAGTETPADVAVIMSWFQEDPSRLGEAAPHGIGGGGKGPNAPEKPAQVVVVAELSGVAVAATQAAARHKGSGGNMMPFMEYLLAAFRQRRGPLRSGGTDKADEKDEGEDGNNGDNNNGNDKNKVKDANDRAVDQAFANFEKLFDLLLKPGGDADQALKAFDLTQYVCDRLEPEGQLAVKWLRQLISVLLERGVPPERRGKVAAAILTLLAASIVYTDPRWARDCLLRLGFDPSGDAPSSEAAWGFQSVLKPSKSVTEIWPHVQVIRTWPEQLRSYLDVLEGKTPSGEFKELENAAKEEWPVLKEALKSKNRGKKVIARSKFPDSCPRCYIQLPSGELGKLNSIGVATAKNCCQRVLIWTGR